MKISGNLESITTQWKDLGDTFSPERLQEVVLGESDVPTPWCLSLQNLQQLGTPRFPRFDIRSCQPQTWYGSGVTVIGALRGVLIVEWDQHEIAADLVSGIYAIPPAKRVRVRAGKRTPQTGDFMITTLSPGSPMRFSRMTATDLLRLTAGGSSQIFVHEFHAELEIIPWADAGTATAGTELLRVTTAAPPGTNREYVFDVANSVRWPPAPWSMSGIGDVFYVVNGGSATVDVLVRQYLVI